MSGTRQAWCAKCGDVVLCDERGCVACRVDQEQHQAQRTDAPIALAAFCAICIEGVIDLRPAQLEKGGPIFTVCKHCDEDGYHPVHSVPEKTGIGNRRGYQPIDETLESIAVLILRRIRHFDWVDPAKLAEAVGIPSKDVDARARNRFDVEMSRLTRQGRIERVGEPMSFVYRITSAGRDEYEYRLQRNVAA
jgi:hypothetical protein